MNKIVFATNNPHKIKEVNEILAGKFQIVSLEEINCFEDIPETSPTIEGNALQKAKYVNEKYKVNCFSEDTGLEIEALNGAPGVITARYAGPERDAHANMDLVLQQLARSSNRKARFLTVIALILEDQIYTFEGIANGHIATQKTGEGGFGYDPIFIPEGYDISFAEMENEVKNKISHRAKAVTKLKDFLLKL